jgi:hypothetical protein
MTTVTHRQIINYEAGYQASIRQLGLSDYSRYPPSTSMFPLSQRGGTRPTSDIEAPAGTVIQRKYDDIPSLTNEPPSIASLMYFHSGCRDIRRITEEGQPHIFDMQIVECFVKRPVELMSLERSGRPGTLRNKNERERIRLCKPREGM